MTCPKCNGKGEVTFHRINDGIEIDGEYACPVCNGSKEFDPDKISNVRFADVDYKDRPDFCDAYVESCDYDGQEANEDILDIINDDAQLIHDLITEHLH